MRILGSILSLVCVTAWCDPVHLEATDGQQWYKGNTHTHTLWSDGDAPPDYVVHWYKSHDYDFLSLTDHNVIALGERWLAYGEGTRISAEHVADLVEIMGDDWVETRDRGGRTELRLKTLPEMQERFDDPGNFLLVAGEEITAASPSVHVNGINVREQVPPAQGGPKHLGIRKHIAAVDDQSARLGIPMFAHVDHPNWNTGLSAEDMLKAGNVRFFEVYNGHSGVHNNGRPKDLMVSTDRLWDILLAMQLHDDGPIVYGVGTDDSHDYYEFRVGLTNPGRGWNMVLAGDLEASALVESFQRGHFYASSGVTLDAVHGDDKEMRVSIAADEGVTYTTQFIGTRKGFDTSATPAKDADGNDVLTATHIYSDTIGVVLHESSANPAVYELAGDELYIRAKVVSSRPHPNPHAKGDFETAWVQPYQP